MLRRDFLHLATASAVGALVRSRPVRVRGAVRSGGKGIANVAVSDSRTIVATASDGTFELVTSSEREFVQIAVPAGYRIPTNPTGTARFHAPMAPEAVFDLEPLPASDENHTLLALGDRAMTAVSSRAIGSAARRSGHRRWRATTCSSQQPVGQSRRAAPGEELSALRQDAGKNNRQD